MTEQHFSTPQPVELAVRIASGDLDVNTVEGDESTVVIDASPKLIDTLRVELVGDRLVIEQQKRSLGGWFGRWDDPLRIRVQIPVGSRVNVATASADTRLDGDFAGLEMKSASGDVALTGRLNGDAIIKTVSGDARLPRMTGDLTGQSVSGDVTVQAVEGSVSVNSVSGDLRIGSVHQGRVNVQSVSGDVELGVAPGTSIDIDAATASGDLASEVPLSDAPDDGSGPTVVIRGNTVSGDFRVVRAGAPV
ncbi:MAG TPA: DUF4097 family beta strand repeat-containing protein [Solirubrobacteraceae bacterium]|nr:DUF4097 family beta strand repeat-containing protein [Solirubrobacteraceae bacterium]